MRINSRMIILITLLLSTSYIFGIEYYEKEEQEISRLYELVSLPDITYKEVSIEISGIKEGEVLDTKAILDKQNKFVEELAHDENCSKLCRITHANTAHMGFTSEEGALGAVAEEEKPATSYALSIKNRQDIGYNSYYKIKLQGLQNIKELDHLRATSTSVLNDWKVKYKENIYFTGTIEGFVDKDERKVYMEALFKALEGESTSYYQDDVSQDVEAYYGYTPKVTEYIIDAKGQRSNTQISFSYNEDLGVTHLIVAFPFYNEPF